MVDKQVQQMPTATNCAIVLEATKEMVGDMLVARDGVLQKTLEMGTSFYCMIVVTS